MARVIELEPHISLKEYAAVAQLAAAVQELRAEGERLVPRVGARRVWMINSTEHGGGVAEMLPTQIALLRELGLDVRWIVMEVDDPRFFGFTKRLHNLMHGEGDPRITDEDREVYDAVSRTTAEAIDTLISDGDLLVVHDPQPLGAAARLRPERDIRIIWRCHIGLDEHLPATRAAWRFLEPHATLCDRAVFSAPEYIPGYLAGRSKIIHPALDPLSHKNRALSTNKLIGILRSAGLVQAEAPMLAPPFPEQAERLQPDGSWGPASAPEEIGLLFRPIVLQVSRWDRLKGFAPLLRGFVRLKEEMAGRDGIPERHRRALEHARLVLAGPDPRSVADDPEAGEVLEEIRELYLSLDPAVQRDVAVVSLPMASRKFNALMVNALQRCSAVVAQNSLREGFGLTATEAMWKAHAVLGTRAVGLRQQIRDGLDGRIVDDASDPDAVARVLDEMLADEWQRDRWGQSAQHRVHHEFLIFTQLRKWLEILAETARSRPAADPERSATPAAERD